MLQLEEAGIESFAVFTKANRFAGVIAMQPRKSGKFWSVYFDSNCVRGSARRFPSVEAAVAFIYDRRVKKGFSV